MKYCKNCLNVDTRPNIKFTEEGLCPPCDYYVNKRLPKGTFGKNLEIEEIKKFAKNHNPLGNNCIVGVSGGKDSTRQALFVREQLGLQPLLVCLSYPPEQVSSIGVNNLSNLIQLGFDCISISCSPKTWRELMKKAFLQFGNWAKSTEMALFASVPRISIAYQIPLVWWGESAATVLGDLGVKGTHPSDANRLKYSNTLAGGDISWMLDSGLSSNQLLQYAYPSDQDMHRSNMRIVFLDYFMGDFAIYTNSVYSSLVGLEFRNPDPLNNADFWGTSMLDEDFFIMNMMIKYLKFGFGRATDNVNEEIRYGRMSRAQGIKLVEKFDGNCSEEIIERFCSYIGISFEDFWNTVDKFVNKDLFQKINGKWTPKFKVGVGL